MKTPGQGKPKGVDSTVGAVKKRALLQAVSMAGVAPLKVEDVDTKECLRSIVEETSGKTLEMLAYDVIGQALVCPDIRVATPVAIWLVDHLAKGADSSGGTNVQVNVLLPDNGR